MNKTDTPAFYASWEYSTLGLAPIPVFGKSKAANLPAGHPFLKRRATEEELNSFDWSSNIGLVTGRVGGIVVLDIDGPEGMESLQEFGLELPDLTATAKTGKGFHVYFKCPEQEIRSRVGFAPGLDLKADGGYVLAPPSVHPNGSAYEWQNNPAGGAPLSLQSFGVEGLAEMPLTLIEATSRRPPKALVGSPDGLVVEGGRNDYLTALAGSLQARGIDDEGIAEMLHHMNRSRCDPPLEEREVEGIARSVCRYKKGELRVSSRVPVEGERENSILASRVSLDLTTAPEPPEMLHAGILMKGKRHVFFGAPGCGKSWLSAYLTVEAMRRGQTVLYLDNENYADEMRTRLHALGADPLAIETLLIYLQSPTLEYSERSGEEYRAALDSIAPDLVVFDSWVNFLTEGDRDENDSKAVSRWSKLYLHPATERGITSVLLDHTPHEGERERGSSRKPGEVEIRWHVKSSRFNQTSTGDMTLTLKKSRSGALPQKHIFQVGGTKDGFVFEPRDSDTPKLSGKQLVAYEYIQEKPGCLRKDIPLAKQTAGDCTQALIDAGLIREDEDRRLWEIQSGPSTGLTP